MKCPEFESILADYLDGTLSQTERAAVELHAAECAPCGVFMAEVTHGVSLLETMQDVEPPQELITRLAFHAPNSRIRDPFERQTLWSRFSQQWLQPMLQPKFVMGAAMMVISFTMLERCTGARVERVQSADLSPVRVLGGMEGKAVRMKDRMLKYYENLRVVYEVEARLRDLQQQQDANDKAAARKPAQAVPSSKPAQKDKP
jgi:anti-sigma factor RsiW